MIEINLGSPKYSFLAGFRPLIFHPLAFSTKKKTFAKRSGILSESCGGTARTAPELEGGGGKLPPLPPPPGSRAYGETTGFTSFFHKVSSCLIVTREGLIA